jgi:hypothetical protein
MLDRLERSRKPHIDNTNHVPCMAMHFKSQSILANLWCASLRGLGQRPSPGLLQCIKTTQMVGPRRHVFAIALTAHASGERQTRNDIPNVLHADLRSRQVASIRPKGNADAVTHAASGQSSLETCALVTFRCKTDTTCCAEMEVRADASLTVSANWCRTANPSGDARWTVNQTRARPIRAAKTSPATSSIEASPQRNQRYPWPGDAGQADSPCSEQWRGYRTRR